MAILIGRRRLISGVAATAALATGLRGEADAAETVSLTFLHVNDIYRHGPQDGFGGLAELGTMIEAQRARARGPVMQTFGGDILSPSIASSITHGAHMIEFLNALGTDVAVLGNHEFDFGSDVAASRIAESRFPWLGANVLAPDGTPFGGAVATVMREAGGMKIGFVGVLTTDTARLCPHADGVTFAAEEPALRAGAEALRREGADVVVALTHLDLAADERMAQAIDGIDLILGGHDHDPMEMKNTGAPILKAASDARWLAVVELLVQRPDPARGRAARVRAVGWSLVPNVDVAPSPRIAPIAARVDAQLEGILSQPLARLDARLDSRTGVVRTREAAIGDVVADALRGYFSAEAALMNGGGLRGDREYPAGTTLTRRDLIAEMPFGNAVEELEVTGAVLRAALEYGVSAVEDAAGRFPQVSGIAFTFDPKAPSGQRIRDVAVGGAPLDPARLYRLATTDYLAAGGDGYAMLRSARVVVDASGGPLLVNVVAEAVAKAGALAAAPDGRSRPV